MPLTPEHKAMWLAALRSGKYTQANGFLYNKTKCGFCCIGVDAAIHGWDIPGEYEYVMKKDETILYNNAQAEEIQCRLYKDELTKEEVSTLIKMNDCGKTFVEIADYIEAHL